MVVRVEAIYEGGSYELARDNQTGLYMTEIEALKRRLQTDERYSYYPVMLRVTDDAGNITIRTISDVEFGADLLLIVREEQIYPLKFIAANTNGEELGYIKDASMIDMDLGSTNDFELQYDADIWNPEYCSWRYRIYIPNTEYGGLVEEVRTDTKGNTITWSGYTWRGLLSQKIIQPPPNQTHLTVSGDANNIIRDIVGSRFGSLFVVDGELSRIQIQNYQFDRFCTVLSGLEKMLSTQNARLKIYYRQGDSGGMNGCVHLCAVPIMDWSNDLEYSQDGKLNFTTVDYRRGINHLICAGEGEGVDRTLIHLYVQSDGTIGERQYYIDLDEREALYAYTSAESVEQLKRDGATRLKELMNYTQLSASIENVDVDMGDIVGGRDRITGLTLSQPIINKILRTQNGNTTVEYKLKGEE